MALPSRPVHSRRCKLNTYACLSCPKSFQSEAGLGEHLRVHSGERPFECSWCPHTFLEIFSMLFHIKRVHPDENPYVCAMCDKGFKNKLKVKSHILTVHDKVSPDAYKCKVCPKTFVHQRNMERHKLVHEQENVMCKWCERQVSSKYELQEHMNIHKMVTHFGCGGCGKLLLRADFLSHRRRCKHKFRSGSEYQGNQDRFYVPRINVCSRYKCHSCPATYMQKDKLNNHQKLHLRKTIICELCATPFLSKYDFQQHVRVHRGMAHTICTNCGKMFIRGDYESHRRKCEGVQIKPDPAWPHKTDSLLVSRTVGDQDEKSDTRIHTRERPYHCDHCPSRFCRKSALKNHSRIHQTHERTWIMCVPASRSTEMLLFLEQNMVIWIYIM